MPTLLRTEDVSRAANFEVAHRQLETRAEVRRQVEAHYAEVWKQGTTEEDTHPSPAERLRLIARLDGPAGDGGPGAAYVEDLFAPAGEDSRATTQVEAFLAAQHEWLLANLDGFSPSPQQAGG